MTTSLFSVWPKPYLFAFESPHSSSINKRTEIPHVYVFLPPADSTRATQATAAHTEEKCVALCWLRRLWFFSMPPTETQRRPKNCLSAQRGLNWTQWVLFAVQLLSHCCVTISSRSAILPRLDLLQNQYVGEQSHINLTLILTHTVSFIVKKGEIWMAQEDFIQKAWRLGILFGVRKDRMAA